jgi:hypothetical protein
VDSARVTISLKCLLQEFYNAQTVPSPNISA